MRKIFISYRRNDSKYQAREVYRALLGVLPNENVFMDVDSIPLGANFRAILKGWVDECEIMLALIGPDWIEASDPQTGERRLDHVGDFVRIEIGEALAHGISVVPVLLDGMRMPDADELPEELKELVDRQAEFIEYRTFDSDMQRLIGKLGLADRSEIMAREEALKEAEQKEAVQNAARQVEIERRRKQGLWEILVDVGSAAQKRFLKPDDVFRDFDQGPEMVVIKPGTFMMGSPKDEPGRDDMEIPHEVTILQPFAMGRYAVIFDEWDA